MATNDLPTNLELIDQYTKELALAVDGATSTTTAHEKFIKGAPTETVDTNQGPIKTLSGQIEDWKETANNEVDSEIVVFNGKFDDSIEGYNQDFSDYLITLGFQPPVPYETGIVINERSQTVSESGLIYFWSGDLPFTTSGNFTTDAEFQIAPITGGVKVPTFTLLQGGILNDKTQAVLGNEGQWYYWNGSFPKTITENSTIESAGGLGDEKFKTAGGFLDLRPTIETSLKGTGHTLSDKTFELGATLVSNKEILLEASSGRVYKWLGDIPKVVDFNSTPISSGGIGENSWKEFKDFVDIFKFQEMVRNLGFRVAGNFIEGCTVNVEGEIVFDLDKTPYIWKGTLPKIVNKNESPSLDPSWAEINISSPSSSYSNSGKSVQTFMDETSNFLKLKIFQSPTDGGLTEIQTRIGGAGEVFEVRKTSNGEYATIYSNAEGTIEIVQNGTSNVSDSGGDVEFYIADGEYYDLTSDGSMGRFSTFVAENSIDVTSAMTVARITDAGVGFANWPQGKGVILGSHIVFGYNHGASHGGAGTYAMCTRTLDGTQFDEPTIIAAPRDDQEEATAFGMIEKDGVIYATVRFRIGGDTGYIENFLYVSDSNAKNWTQVMQLPDILATGLPCILYHGGVITTEGKLAYGYHDYEGSLGVLTIDLSDNSTQQIELLSAANNNVDGVVLQAELNFFKRQDTDKIFIISRTQQNSVQKPLAWVAEGDFSGITNPVETPLLAQVNPVTPVLSPSFDEVFFYYCDRYNSYGSSVSKAALYQGRLQLEDAFNLNFDDYKYIKLLDLSGGTTSTGAESGVQHAVRKGDQVYIAFGSRDMYESKRTDVFCLTQDYANDSKNSQCLGALRSTQSNGRAEIDLNAVSRYDPRIRFDGKSVLNRNNVDSRNEIGSYNDEGYGLAIYTEMDGGQSPAVFIGSFNDKFTGDAGVIEINRDLALRGSSRTLHLDDNFRLRVGSSTATKGNSAFYYDKPTSVITLGSYGKITYNICTSESHPLIISSQYDTDYSAVRFQSGSNFRDAKFKSNSLECDFYITPKAETLASLAPAAIGATAFCTNGRRSGEGAGGGSGVPVYSDGTVWRTFYDNTEVLV